MVEYQVFARKYRPQKFSDVLAQEAIVLTLMRAIAHERVGSAYLFAGPHGTGKTTLARLFAKALNCKNLSKEGEPCNECLSCKEIGGGYSLDVLEIDGASHRGIEDIRQINETIAYRATALRYKIYLIDEVHMLTKEAFNALLKSLEEPPSHVKFFFATTEAHLIPATILSRCQRFNLKRIPQKKIVEKLSNIARDLTLDVEEEALELLTRLAEGGLRDAESLFDELVSYENKKITVKSVRELFGLPSEDIFAQLDRAASTRQYSAIFPLVESLFAEGKNIAFFLEALTNHFRHHLLHTSPLYTKSHLLEILSLLAQAQVDIKHTPSKRSFLEILLLRIVELPQKASLESLVERLEALEKRVKNPSSQEVVIPPTIQEKAPKEIPAAPIEKKEETPPIQEKGQETVQEKSRYDTLMRFAAKEFHGSLKRSEE
jgi:DNA polymerase-3 subunit gamma/tau